MDAKTRKGQPSPPSRWIGRLAEAPGVWFLAWGPDRARVKRLVEADIGAVERGSLRRIKGAGYFLFRATAKRPGVEPSPGEYLILYDEDAEEWIASTNARVSP